MREFQKRGRPRKEIDEGVLFHMLKNKAPVSAIAKHLGVNRDTIYVRYRHLIREGRLANIQAWRVIITPLLEEKIRKKKLKMTKRRYIHRYH